jgi:DNA helicase-2/ATP-dependent DNA helicase PcrA
LGPENNLLVVGDDDQSIYGFRGANINNLLQFESDFPETKFVKLEQNYRSTSNILEAAHAVIEKNSERKDKKLWTESESGHQICSYLASDESDEANFVVQQIQQHQKAGLKLSEIAIFYRIHAQSRALEEALMSAGVPFVIFGGQKFYDRKEIKDIIAYLRLLLNPDDNQAFLRVVNVPARGIGGQTIAALANQAVEEQSSLLAVSRKNSNNKKLAAFCGLIDELQKRAGQVYLSALIEDVLNKTGYLEKLKTAKDENSESRVENLRELKAIARQMENSSPNPIEALRNFIDRCALSFSDDKPEEEVSEKTPNSNDRVSLMTLHLAKGLEFPVVFLTGMEEGLLPHSRARLEKNGVAEERRLCYVGMTRAMSKLYLTRTVTRGMFSSGGSFGNSGYFREISPFLADVPVSYLDNINSDQIASYAQSDFYESEDSSVEDVYQSESSIDDCDTDFEPSRRFGSSFKKKKTPKNKNRYLSYVFSAEDLDQS